VRSQRSEELVTTIDLALRAVGRGLDQSEGVAAIGGAENGSAEPRDVLDVVGNQLDQAAVGKVLRKQQTVVALANADDLPTARVRRTYGRLNDRVQPGRVAAAGFRYVSIGRPASGPEVAA